ncbi:alpha/beta hydrolase [Methylorubrum suomiense]|uniref:Ferri-bacillibactin esterase BesA n=1 Tax=Methylorubrum suomiense TaxID=144191 RepID=A0ABQ4US11_9HYPH|nr:MULTISPECIES: alpha/beta hydrolase-fold protein [Methylobacteriaceae]GJE74968.1 Ferri-bacillibactin esterase BesA [Methylorubrum suomiense]
MGDHISRRATIGLIFAAGLVNARRSIAAPIEQDVPAQIPGAIRFDLGGRDGRLPWRITLYVPPGDAPAAGWPVLYLLDGNAVTATAIDIERVQASYPEATGITSRFVVVGIGYPTTDAYDVVRRCWDYTPPPGRTYPSHQPGAPPVRTGGAAEFLRFITGTLKPTIEHRCRIDQARQALFGHSFGGLFTLYALAQAPSAFSHWIAASPSIYWEDRVLLASFAVPKDRPHRRQRVLLLAGAYEEEPAPFYTQQIDRENIRTGLDSAQIPQQARDLTSRLKRDHGFSADFRLIPRRTHMAALPEALNEAVAFFLQSGA